MIKMQERCLSFLLLLEATKLQKIKNWNWSLKYRRKKKKSLVVKQHSLPMNTIQTELCLFPLNHVFEDYESWWLWLPIRNLCGKKKILRLMKLLQSLTQITDRIMNTVIQTKSMTSTAQFHFPCKLLKGCYLSLIWISKVERESLQDRLATRGMQSHFV